MLWAALSVAATVAGVAIAAAGLLVRPTRLAVPVHALGMALAFTAGGVVLSTLSEWIGRGAVWAEMIAGSGWVLVFFILPFCVIAAVFATLALRWPGLATIASILIVAIAPLYGAAGTLFLVGVISAMLVLPTVLAHRYVLSLPVTDAGGRFRAVAGWTCINGCFVVLMGRAGIMPMLNMEWD